ncbi:MAG: hypothetical protein ACH37Z_06150 [Anaerolineae bacterium]
MNNRGDVVYTGWLDAATGVFVNRKGVNSAVARTGEPAPGGGNHFNIGCNQGNYGIADNGKIAFGAVLDSDGDYNTLEGSHPDTLIPHPDTLDFSIQQNRRGRQVRRNMADGKLVARFAGRFSR